jgi:hypothetical protein
MSCDWGKYSSAQESRARARDPAANGIVILTVTQVRSIEVLSLVHKPEDRNRSHSEVFGLSGSGPQRTERRLLLWNATRPAWTIAPD